MKSTPITAIILSLALGAFTAVAGPVTVTNVTAAQRIGAAIVDIAYDLLNPSGGIHTVAINVSTNAGATYSLACTNFSGAVGATVTTGTNKQVVWFAAGDLPEASGVTARVRVTAMDDMALIPAGPFQMGTNFTDDGTSAQPNHTVTLSAFFMDKHEVTSQQWQDVYIWATNNGYAFTNPGAGKVPNHPVQMVNWYNCVKWCNARSEKEGLTPCYYTNAAQTLVYRGGSANLSNEWVNWSANGYRLPTEAEWEKAARGGAVGMRFPWSDANAITNSRANYYGNTAYAYDLGPNGYNPAFTNEPMPYTSPVGYFAPNGYGLYDMAGNVWEWCWDRYDASWYSNTGATQNDTCGPSSGSDRVLRGGGWAYSSNRCRVASRSYYTPDGADEGIGFRCVRR